MTRRAVPAAPVALLLAAGLAWWLSADRMRDMDAGPSAQLGGLGWFTATWVLMMAAMMLPATLPMFAAARRPAAPPRVDLGRLATVAAYLAVWTGAGALAFAALRAGRVLGGDALAWHRAGRWLCVAVVAGAAGYQLTAVKARWLTRCHAPARDSGGSLTASLREGARAGVRCLASSWALMAVLFAMGAMSLAWMAAVAALIVAERTAPLRAWRGRPGLRRLSAALLAALAVGLAAAPGSVPGFTVPSGDAGHRMMMRGMPG